MEREAVEQIVKTHHGILTRTAKKLGVTVPYIRQVVILGERNSADVWKQFAVALKEMKREKQKKENEQVQAKEKFLAEATA